MSAVFVQRVLAVERWFIDTSFLIALRRDFSLSTNGSISPVHPL